MKTNQEYKNAALAVLKGNWAPAVVCTIVMMIISFGISMLSSLSAIVTVTDSALAAVISLTVLLLSFFFLLPLGFGYYQSFKLLCEEGDNRLTANMFRQAFGIYGRNLAAGLLMILYVFLWTLLFIIPGVIKSFAYAMIPFILKDYPELSANQAISLSQKMMKGHKFDYFWLMLSFIGWYLLGVLSLGLGYLWLIPYCYTSTVGFYEDVKKEYLEKSTL